MVQKLTTAGADGYREATRAKDGTSELLLAGGVLAGPLFVLVAMVQGLTRDGFDFQRHPVSLLSLGYLGWIQIANFVVAGLLSIACAFGMRRVLRSGKGSVWGPRLIGLFGASLVAGGVFVADPGLGFPPGTPEGMAETFSWHGIVHAIAPVVGFNSLIVACFVLARRYAASGERGWAAYSAATGAVTFPLSAVPSLGGSYIFLGIALILGFAWLTSLSVKLMNESSY